VTVKNGAGSSMSLTIAPSGNTSYNVANPSKVFTIPATSEKDIPMLGVYAASSDGLVAFTWSSTTTVTWAVKTI
jgi:hypothetical protein